MNFHRAFVLFVVFVLDGCHCVSPARPTGHETPPSGQELPTGAPAEVLALADVPYSWTVGVRDGQEVLYWTDSSEGKFSLRKRILSESESRLLLQIETTWGAEVFWSRTAGSPIVLFKGLNPNRFPVNYVVWSEDEGAKTLASCDTGAEFPSTGGSDSDGSMWFALPMDCTGRCPTGRSLLIQRMHPYASHFACLFEDDVVSRRDAILSGTGREAATLADGTLRIFSFDADGGVISEQSESSIQVAQLVSFIPGSHALLVSTPDESNHTGFALSEADLSDAGIVLRPSRLGEWFDSVRSVKALRRGYLVVGSPKIKPGVQGEPGFLVGRFSDDGGVSWDHVVPTASGDLEFAEVGDKVHVFEGDSTDGGFSLLGQRLFE